MIVVRVLAFFYAVAKRCCVMARYPSADVILK